MFKTFYPGDYLDSTYIIDFEKLYSEGVRGLIFDIDNTLVEHGIAADDRAIKLFERLRKIGYQTCLISNNQEPRVKPFANDVKAKFISNAHKPLTKNYINAMKIMKTNKSNTIFIGDQLFTDVWGANKAGIRTILVKPVGKKEEIQIVIKRYLEKVVLFFYKQSLRRKVH